MTDRMPPAQLVALEVTVRPPEAREAFVRGLLACVVAELVRQVGQGEACEALYRYADAVVVVTPPVIWGLDLGRDADG